MKSTLINRFIILFLVISILLSLPAVPLYATQETPNPDMVRVFIGFTLNPGSAEEALIRAFGGEIRYTYSIIPAISAELPEQTLRGLQNNPKVTIIEPVIEAFLISDYQAELDNTWGVKRIQAGPVHIDGYFGQGIKVAVIDSGIDYNHSDLAGNYKGGYDFADKNNDPMDLNGHGTHVAGIIAALRNGIGVVGTAPEAQLYALKVFPDSGGNASFDDIVAAVEWAVTNGVRVTNSSYGSLGNPGSLVEQTFDNAYAAGVLHIAAAGNDGNAYGLDNILYPARYDSVIAVAASTSNDARASFSSRGPTVELIAPGVSIRSTYLDNSYVLTSGTSMASPHVAGVAALVWAVNPKLTNIETRGILNDTAEDLGLSSNHQGHGLVRADLAVEQALATLSSHADLSALTISEGRLNPAFESGITDYTVDVAHDKSTIGVTATLSDENATLTIEGNPATSGVPRTVNLGAAGTATPIDILVTAEDGVTTKTYTITINRSDGNYDLILPLNPGWNLLSLPRRASEIYVESLDIEAWLGYSEGAWINSGSLSEELINPARAVFIKVIKPTEVYIKWDELAPGDEFASQQLVPGWNLISTGYRSDYNSVLADIRYNGTSGLIQLFAPNSFNGRKGFGYHLPWSSPLVNLISPPQGDGEEMYPFDGYWVYLRGEGVKYYTPVSYDTVWGTDY